MSPLDGARRADEILSGRWRMFTLCVLGETVCGGGTALACPPGFWRFPGGSVMSALSRTLPAQLVWSCDAGVGER